MWCSNCGNVCVVNSGDTCNECKDADYSGPDAEETPEFQEMIAKANNKLASDEDNAMERMREGEPGW